MKQKFNDVGFAKLEPGRARRQGFPEAIFSPGKTSQEVAVAFETLLRGPGPVMATRVTEDQARQIQKRCRTARYVPDARMVVAKPAPQRSSEPILVISAGTTDRPAAEEAAVTLETLGHRVVRIYDVGVSAVDRLLRYRRRVESAKAIIVVAGMEGALASVVGGLAACLVVAVPTSSGYGSHFNGIAPLLTMMNSCAANVCVVNIDNGFGAGVCAAMAVR